jgi:hypothetical protein
MSAPTPKEIRECYRDYRNAWQEIRDQAMLDMQAISITGPWTAEDRGQREDAGRPCVHLDQINQFLNQTNGNVRKNKRSVKCIPKGDGANDADAKKRSDLIMGIEERSQAQPIYLNAFQCMTERSYGFAVIRTEYRDDSSFDQEILIKPIQNPDTVLISPNYKQPDASDIPDGFLLDRQSKQDFEREYPDADATDFSDDDQPGLADWITEKTIQKAEYWKVEHDLDKLLLVRTPQGMKIMLQDELKEFKARFRGPKGKFAKLEVAREREIRTPRVVQYLTNGLEILDTVEWGGKRIPIISCLGPERWVTEGGTAKRQLMSLVRFARDPQMLFDFLASQECEEAGMVPKVPFIGAKGQFESDQETWEELNRQPHAYVEYDAIADATGDNPLPAPSRPQYQANFQQYELAKDSASRSLQAAMGISPLPDAAQRRNQKSGVALQKIDDMESLGVFHFVDRFENCFLYNVGWQLNDLISTVLDTEQQMPIAQPDGKRALLHVVGNTSHPINESGTYQVQGTDGQPLPEGHIHTGKGEFDVTISTGPAEASEREEQSDFLDSLLDNIANLPQPGTPQAKVLALAIRMRPTLGAVGTQIAEIFDPPPPDPNMPPQFAAQLQQLQAQLAQATQENSALHLERAGKVLEQQTKLLMQQMKEDGANWREQLANDIKVLVAEIGAKSQAASERAQMYETFWKENHTAAHEAGLQAADQQHDRQQQEQLATLMAQSPSLQPGQPDGGTAPPQSAPAGS